MTLFGKRVFAGVIKLRRSPIGLGWALNPTTGVLKRKGKLDTDTQGRS